MSTQQDQALGPPVQSSRELVEWFAAGEKPRARWRIGTEHEKFVFRTPQLGPVPYEGKGGVRHLLLELVRRFAWEPLYESGEVIALRHAHSQAMVSLEPGGQFELSGAPLSTLHETRAEMEAHFAQVCSVGRELGLGFTGLGHAPTWRLAETPSMPKGRYAIMKRYMPSVGGLGLDMMYRTATVQVNLDFDSEADMVKKLRVGMALQPVVSALFANSPFRESSASGLLSARCNVWLDTDAARCGIPAFVFESGMGYERYAEYALDVPMYFVHREGRYVDVAGESFRRFLEGRLPQLPGELPRLSDWVDHLSTLFPEVRLKRYLEMRGADSGDLDHLCALPALWTGILYDSQALDHCWELVRHLTLREMEDARRDVPRLGLKAACGPRPVLALAREVVAAAHGGLRRRAVKDAQGRDECIHLRSVQGTAATGITPAEVLLLRYENGWNRRAERALTDAAFA